LLTDKQTYKQRRIHNLLGGGNNRYFFSCCSTSLISNKDHREQVSYRLDAWHATNRVEALKNIQWTLIAVTDTNKCTERDHADFSINKASPT